MSVSDPETQHHLEDLVFLFPRRAFPGLLRVLSHLAPGSKTPDTGQRGAGTAAAAVNGLHQVSLGRAGGFLTGHRGSSPPLSCSETRSTERSQSPSDPAPATLPVSSGLGAALGCRWGASFPAVTERSGNSENQRTENVHGGITECVSVQKARPFKR